MDWSKKKILVTGGNGFIGSNLVNSLLQDDRVQKVRVIDNYSNGFKQLHEKKCSYKPGSDN